MQGQKLFFILHNTSQFMNWTAIPNELYFTRGNFPSWNVLTIPESNTKKNNREMMIFSKHDPLNPRLRSFAFPQD